MIVLSAFLAVPETLPCLQTLRLDDNRIGAAGCAALAVAMASGSSAALLHLSKLHLQRNAIGDLGLKQLTVRRLGEPLVRFPSPPSPALPLASPPVLPLASPPVVPLATPLSAPLSAPPSPAAPPSRRRCGPGRCRN